jgi:hypothetical protein
VFTYKLNSFIICSKIEKQIDFNPVGAGKMEKQKVLKQYNDLINVLGRLTEGTPLYKQYKAQAVAAKARLIELS